MSIRCLITGCALREQFNPRYAWGDLHQVRSVMVFVAVRDPATDGVRWILPEPGEETSHRSVVLRSDTIYLERQGVFVIDGGMELLNDEAREYVEKWE